jgi:ribosomal protein S7
MENNSQIIANYNYLRLNQHPLYESFLVTKFINKFIKHGRKQCAERAVHQAFVQVKQQLNENPAGILLKSITLLKPFVGVAKLFKLQGKRRRRKTLLIPVPLVERQQLALGLTWFVRLILNNKK